MKLTKHALFFSLAVGLLSSCSQSTSTEATTEATAEATTAREREATVQAAKRT